MTNWIFCSTINDRNHYAGKEREQQGLLSGLQTRNTFVEIRKSIHHTLSDRRAMYNE